MIFLREALEKAPLSPNWDQELVQQAQYMRRKRGRQPMEQYVVMTREGSAMYFHLVWDQALRESEGDWTAINALACADLDELYQTASAEVRAILDDTHWDSI